MIIKQNLISQLNIAYVYALLIQSPLYRADEKLLK
jgi:hypothetical protein